MRVTIVILLTIFGLILCANLSASTYMQWQRFRTDMAVDRLRQMVQDTLPAKDLRQQAFDNCVKLSLAYPRVGDSGVPLYPAGEWKTLILLCEKYREAILPPSLKNLP